MSAAAAPSRRDRVFELRRFILDTFQPPSAAVVLDVAGGKGDLSWALANADGIDSVVVGKDQRGLPRIGPSAARRARAPPLLAC